MENRINSLLSPHRSSHVTATPHSFEAAKPAPHPAPPQPAVPEAQVLVPFLEDGAVRDLAMTLEIVASLRPGARVTLLRVLPHLSVPAEQSFHWLDAIELLHRELRPCPATVLEKARASLASGIEREIPAQLRTTLKLRAECRAGDPAAEIARFANEHHVDLVVLTGERARWRWPFSRPLPDRVLHLTDRPVIILHPPRKPNRTAPSP